jgi:hypothetical protein
MRLGARQLFAVARQRGVEMKELAERVGQRLDIYIGPDIDVPVTVAIRLARLLDVDLGDLQPHGRLPRADEVATDNVALTDVALLGAAVLHRNFQLSRDSLARVLGWPLARIERVLFGADLAAAVVGLRVSANGAGLVGLECRRSAKVALSAHRKSRSRTCPRMRLATPA